MSPTRHPTSTQFESGRNTRSMIRKVSRSYRRLICSIGDVPRSPRTVCCSLLATGSNRVPTIRRLAAALAPITLVPFGMTSPNDDVEFLGPGLRASSRYGEHHVDGHGPSRPSGERVPTVALRPGRRHHAAVGGLQDDGLAADAGAHGGGEVAPPGHLLTGRRGPGGLLLEREERGRLRPRDGGPVVQGAHRGGDDVRTEAPALV